jgi:NADPH:quinone reductase-like Zn-dependent oxidoreductase
MFFSIQTTLDWVTFGAIPETYFTAWGCTIETLKLKENPKVVIRPGASALGLAITNIVNHLGGEAIGVTRSESKVQKLLDAGMKEVIVSSDPINDTIRKIWKGGADGVVDTIVSEMSVKDDLQMLSESGMICLAGSLADSYGTSKSADFIEALKDPRIDFYGSDRLHVDKDGKNLQTIIDRVEAGIYKPNIDAIYEFKDLQQAHIKMDNNQFAGKVVIKV